MSTYRGGVCYETLVGRWPPWRVLRSPEHCITLVDPCVVEPNTLELSAAPRLLSDPGEAIRTLEPRVLRLDPAISGVTTVRFQLTHEGTVHNTRVARSSGHDALDDAVTSIAGTFEFSPGSTVWGPAEVPMEYVVGFEPDRRARLLRWLSAIRG